MQTFFTSVIIFGLLTSQNALAQTEPLFADEASSQRVFKHLQHEKELFAHPVEQAKSGVLQRSGRMRLYDHNIFLRAFFAGNIEHREAYNLGNRFEKALFVDIGSAVMNGKGAPTVRDIFEDKVLTRHLDRIVATDINDRSDANSAYIDRYKRRIKASPSTALPFPVSEIPMLIDSSKEVERLVQPHQSSSSQPLILRSASSGPDLYYSDDASRKHLIAVAQAGSHREVMYFFNKFVLYKPAHSETFQIIGEDSADVGFNHDERPWEKKELWQTRKLSDGFTPNLQFLCRPGSTCGSPARALDRSAGGQSS